MGKDDRLQQVEVKVAHAKQQGMEATQRLLKAVDQAVGLAAQKQSPELSQPFAFRELLQGVSSPALSEYAESRQVNPLELPWPEEWTASVPVSAEVFNRWNAKISHLQEKGVKVTLPDLWNKAVMMMSGKTEVHTVMSQTLNHEYQGVENKEILSVVFDMLPKNVIAELKKYQTKMVEAVASHQPVEPPSPELVQKLLTGIELYNKQKKAVRQGKDLVAFMATLAGDFRQVQKLIQLVSQQKPLAGLETTKAVAEPGAGMTSVTETRRYIVSSRELHTWKNLLQNPDHMRRLRERFIPATRMEGKEVVASVLPDLQATLPGILQYLQVEGGAWLVGELGRELKAEQMRIAGDPTLASVAEKQQKMIEFFSLQLEMLIRKHERANQVQNVTTAMSDIYQNPDSGVYAICPNGEKGIHINSRLTEAMLGEIVSLSVEKSVQYAQMSETVDKYRSAVDVKSEYMIAARQVQTLEERLQLAERILKGKNISTLLLRPFVHTEIQLHVEARLRRVVNAVDTLLYVLDAGTEPGSTAT